MTCPHLEYRKSGPDHTEGPAFDHQRPYCRVQETFVSPMRADICNDRFDFHHGVDCEVFKTHEAAGEAGTGTADGVETPVDRAIDGHPDTGIEGEEILRTDGSSTD